MKPSFYIKSITKKWATPGQKARGIFIKFCEVHDMAGEKLIPGVRWVEADMQVYHSAQRILVDDCKKFDLQKGASIEITYKGKKNGTQCGDFDISLLVK
jgi:hypothetical protein